MHYLDHAATTPVHPQVAQAMQDALLQGWANPSALYPPGLAAEDAMQAARATLAGALGAPANTVFFTSGGTEANNMAILGAARARRAWGTQLVATGYEHPSAAKPLEMLANTEGFSLTTVPPGPHGRVDPEALLAAVGPQTALVCAMHVNNETGAVLDVAGLAAAVKQKNPRTFVHVDGVQAFCKLPLTLGATQIDSYAVSAHKLHGPKGSGALYLKGGKGAHILPPFAGGGQEGGVRPGTENTAGIAGFAKAVELALAAQPDEQHHVARLRQSLLQGLAAIEGVIIHSPEDGAVNILFFSMPRGLKSQVMLNHLYSDFSVCVSSGSACSGGAPSHTLTAMGLHKADVDAALRVSFSGENTSEDIHALLAGLHSCLGLKRA